MNPFGAYAHYYDLLYQSKDYAKEVAYVSRIVERWAPGAKNLLDLGCGTGIHACAFARAGYRVTGIDRSDEMLELARARARREFDAGWSGSVEFTRGDICDFDLARRFDVVTALFHVMSYLPTNNELDATVWNVQKHLDPSGLFVFDHWYGPAVLTERPVQRVKVFENDKVKIVRVATPTLHVNDNLVDVNYDLLVIDKVSGQCEQFSESHRMRYLFRPEITSVLACNGFVMAAFNEWLSDNVPSDTSWNTVVAAHRRS
jgi:SAM-dependent methyltransferase